MNELAKKNKFFCFVTFHSLPITLTRLFKLFIARVMSSTLWKRVPILLAAGW
jgi:hypothetical protein